ncbi:hypothetical protein GLOIN_2v1882079 [Rhizophagus clarus]|uniref:F-box domain-containing protein n=1 Tax=Rhizophagus clarus TaxID=94130 RepID=A0A8H3KRH9_9GLOM|nr:hypothetical protein GLOIN_2v1882079 [Rhizophagus clarus]
MSKLNSDVLYLIFEQLQHDNKTIQSCLLVNRTSCEIVIPILWKNPWQYNLNYKQHLLLLNIIISNLPHELKIIYKSKGIYTLPNSYKPLFNYIKFCNYLNLEKFCSLTSIMNDKIELFINGNTRFTHIILPYDSFNFSLHNLPGSIHSLSGLEFLNCHTLKNDDILIGLAGICNSIKELKLITYLNPYFTNFKNDTENFGIIKLIENQKRLSCVQLHFVDYEYVATKYHKRIL